MVAAVMPTNVALQQIMSGKYMQIFDDDKESIADLRIDNDQVVDSAKILLKTFRMFEMHLKRF
jgi:hypothetical protein